MDWQINYFYGGSLFTSFISLSCVFGMKYNDSEVCYLE